MFDPWNQPWSYDLDAPPITKYDYVAEKSILAGSFIGSILYGLLTTLFFQCMTALLNSAHRREEGIKWWLILYTVAMFLFATVYTAINFHIESISFIDHRQGIPDEYMSGPLLWQFTIRDTPLGLIPNVMFSLNNWLADGLLIYRCYIIYPTNLWAIALPCLMYLASLGMGITMLYFQRYGDTDITPVYRKFSIPYLSISVSLNILLTLMIVIRLVLHGRDLRAAPKSPVGIRGLYRTASTMLIESCALFAMSSLFVLGALVSVEDSYLGHFIADIFFPILAETQVIAPLLIIQRVANGSAVTSRTITTGHPYSFNIRNQGELMSSECVPLGGYPASSAAGYGTNPGEPGVVVETTTDFHPDGR